MATEIAKAYVQLVPSARGFKSGISSAIGGDVSSAGDSAGESFGASMIGKLKGVLAAAGIGAIVKEALTAGGDLQQSFGGLDTLYGEASQAAKDYAKEAASAGISMNDYAEQAVSFGASLKSAFSGDVTKAAEAANTAIMDMADNSAKMGTDIQSVQNAYQGFAKQNYTMLDNLKLGYGGTKTEMQRLLADAEKLSGVKYDIDNLGDVYSAIHVIQEDLGLTGVAAEEASTTFTGSFGAMKAAATNLLAELTTGGDITSSLQTLSQTIFTFINNNLVPMIGTLLSNIPTLLSEILSEAVRGLNIVSNNADTLVAQGVELIGNIVTGILESLPYLLEAALNLIVAFAQAFFNYDWVGFANNFIGTIKENMAIASGEIFGSDESLLDALISWVANTLPEMLEKGVEIVTNLVNGVYESLPDVIASMITVMAKITSTIWEHLPEILQKGIELIGKLLAGIISAIPTLIAGLPKVFRAIKSAFEDYDWLTLGKNILEGIKNGIISAVSLVVDAAREAASAIFDAVKDFFEIGSPSKLMKNEIGKWIPAGIAVGIEGNISDVTDAMEELNNETMEVASKGLDYSMTASLDSFEGNENEEIYTVISLLNKYLPSLGNQQIVLDSGTLVGATVNQMDRALGKLSNKNQRGVYA